MITEGKNYRDYTNDNGTTVRIYDNNLVGIITINRSEPLFRIARARDRKRQVGIGLHSALLRFGAAQR